MRPTFLRHALVTVLAVPALTVTVAAGPAAAGEDRIDAARPAPAPLIFAHRGASAYRPEHTLASYELAIRMGADVIEPDLVSTKDHVLVARHENEISGTTDVASRPEFAARRTTKTIDGVVSTGWFTEDFTLAELKQLRAVERLPDVRQENTIFNGRFAVPTLPEVISLARSASRQYGRRIGLAPETKHPTYFDSIGLSLEEPLVRTLRANGLDRRDSQVYVQSFETANLMELRRQFRLTVHLVQLTSPGTTARPYDHVVSGNPQTYAQMTTPAGLRRIARYADVLGPEKTQIFPRDAAGTALPPTRLIAHAHAAGLKVVTYTVRPENQFLALQYRIGADPNAYGDVLGELADLFQAGVDGVFADAPDIAYEARREFFDYRRGMRAAPAA